MFINPTLRTGTIASAVLLGMAQPMPGQERPLQMEFRKIHDPMAGCNAVQILAPIDWKVDGAVTWNLAKGLLADVHVRCRDTRGPGQVELLPLLGFIWAADWEWAYPRGTLCVGAEMQPPVRDLNQFMTQVILPRHRAGERARIVAHENLPDLAREVAGQLKAREGMEHRVLAGRTRIEYAVAGQPVEEDITCTLAFAVSPFDGKTVLWKTERLFAVRAARGRLKVDGPLLNAMASSWRLEKDWFNIYVQVAQNWVQIQQQRIRDDARISKVISDMSKFMSEERRKMWQSWQESRDRTTSRFIDAIKGVERYESPYHDHPIELPAGHTSAWVDGQGRYVLSPEAGFDPNRTLPGTWRELRKTP